MADDDDDPPERPKRKARPLRPPVRAFVSRKDVVQWVFDHAKSKVPFDEHEQVAQDALTEAVEKATWPESDEEGVLWATLRTVTDRTIADYLEKRATRREYEGAMPDAPTLEDEAGERVLDEEADIDPARDPEAEDGRLEGMLLRRFLAHAVKGNARDEETYGWMIAWSDDDKGYAEIARDAKVNRNTVHGRVHEFKEKYLPEYKRWRNRMLLLVLLGAVLAVAVYVALRAASPRRPKVEDIRPAPDFPWLVPSSSASGEPVEGPPAPPPSFNNALPTQPQTPPQERKN